jgi:hypothetical protein
MKKFKKSKVIIIGIIAYLFVGVLFYMSDLKVQQQLFSCPNTISPQYTNQLPTKELIEYSEKNCIRNRSTIDFAEITTAVSMTTLWLPLIVGRAINN